MHTSNSLNKRCTVENFPQQKIFFIFLCNKARLLKNRLLFIYGAFGLSLLVIVIIALLLLKNFISIKESDLLVEHTYEVKNQILKAKADLIEAENNQREFLLLKDRTLLLPVSQTQKSTFREIDSLKSLTADNMEQQQLIKKLKGNISLWYQILYATIDDANDDETNFFNANSEKGNRILKQIMYLLDQMNYVESNLLKKRKEKKSTLEIAAPRYLGFILLVSVFFQLISSFTIIAAFKRRRIHQKIIEQKIKELNATNSELEQIAFVASHDLQEPLRKIRTFSDKLIIQHKDVLNKEGKIIVEKIAVSSQRMQELLNDLINYSHVTKNEEEAKKVDLKICFDEACKALEEVIKKKNTVIKVDGLPIVEGYYKQLYLLFYNLIDNALKFSNPGDPPVINVVASEETGEEVNSANMFVKIAFSDNGIGFEKEFSEKIFIIFKRLHATSSPLKGKGIGLAICRKVMLNHNGYITAKGEAGAGATFNLYFPVNNID